MNSTFDLIISGIGAYQCSYLGYIIAYTAALQGIDVKKMDYPNGRIMGGELSFVRMGKDIHSPLPFEQRVDLIICFEPVIGAVHVAKYLSPQGVIIANESPVINSAHLVQQAYELVYKLARKVITYNAGNLCYGLKTFKIHKYICLGILNGLGKIPLDESCIMKTMEILLPEQELCLCREGMRAGKGLCDEYF